VGVVRAGCSSDLGDVVQRVDDAVLDIEFKVDPLARQLVLRLTATTQRLARHTHTHRRTRPTHTHPAVNSMSRQVCVQIPTYGTLTTWHCPHHSPAAAAARRRAVSDRYLMRVGPTAANPHQTDAPTSDRCIDQTWNWVIGSPGQWVIFHVRLTGSSF